MFTCVRHRRRRRAGRMGAEGAAPPLARAACARAARGFTLVELLLVLAILGALVAVVAPYVGAGMAGSQLATASRTVAQAARYAHAMALLHQAETELVLTSAAGEGGSGKIEVRAVAGAAPEAVPADDGEFNGDDGPGGGAETNAVGAAQGFADEIASAFEVRGISFLFEGYDDGVDDSAIPPEEDGDPAREFPPVTVRFGRNGICRPFSVRVQGGGGELSHLVKVNRRGLGKIEGYGDEE